jgi:hypothetical protein
MKFWTRVAYLRTENEGNVCDPPGDQVADDVFRRVSLLFKSQMVVGMQVLL